MDSICQCWLVEVWRTGSDGCLRNSTGKQDCADRWWSCWCWWLCWWWGDPDIVMKIIMIWWLVFQTSNPSGFFKSVTKYDYVAKSHHCSVLGRPSKNCFTFLLWKKNNLHLGCRHSWRSWRSSKMLQSLFLIRISPTPASIGPQSRCLESLRGESECLTLTAVPLAQCYQFVGRPLSPGGSCGASSRLCCWCCQRVWRSRPALWTCSSQVGFIFEAMEIILSLRFSWR